MRYWPMSVIATSPLVQHPGFAWELAQVYRTCYLSEPAFRACGDVAAHTPHRNMPGLVILESVDASWRQAFTEYPSYEEWATLERAGVIENSLGVMYVIIDALH